MTESEMWENEESVTELGISVPAWMEDVSPCDVIAVYQGGCGSGAYMPAVTYATANAVMAEHGDDVLEFIEQYYGEIPQPNGQSWSQMASFYLSIAVEIWAQNAYTELEDM